MAELFSQDQISVDEIYSAMDEKIAESRENRSAMLESFVVFYNSLDSEQRQEIKPMIAKILKDKKNSRGKKGHDRH